MRRADALQMMAPVTSSVRLPSVCVQGALWLTANLSSAEPLTAA